MELALSAGHVAPVRVSLVGEGVRVGVWTLVCVRTYVCCGYCGSYAGGAGVGVRRMGGTLWEENLPSLFLLLLPQCFWRTKIIIMAGNPGS